MTEPGVGVRVRTHPALCTGFGNCHRWAANVYPLDEDGRVDIHLLEVPAELADEARLGAQVCPAGAITVIEPTPAHARAAAGEETTRSVTR